MLRTENAMLGTSRAQHTCSHQHTSPKGSRSGCPRATHSVALTYLEGPGEGSIEYTHAQG